MNMERVCKMLLVQYDIRAVAEEAVPTGPPLMLHCCWPLFCKCFRSIRIFYVLQMLRISLLKICVSCLSISLLMYRHRCCYFRLERSQVSLITSSGNHSSSGYYQRFRWWISKAGSVLIFKTSISLYLREDQYWTWIKNKKKNIFVHHRSHLSTSPRIL